MSISSATFGVGAVTEQPSAHDVRSDHDRTPDEFAGVLAGVVHANAKPLEHRKAPEEGTSELDRQEESEHSDRKVKRSHSASGPKTDASPDATQSDPNAVVQSVAALDPELQAKLARVMSRMQSETGHDVEVAETVRSQTRQDALFAQGRTEPGNIVTWTQSSKHTQGRAVDLVLDNGTAAPDAYASLQRIAGEEGLHTLGARDPGHLELPGATKGAADATSIPDEPAGASGPGQVSIARLAHIAQVTQVSVEPPAQVANVASVARPGAPSDTSRTTPLDAPQPNRSEHGNAPTQSVQSARNVASNSQSASHRFGSDTNDRDSGAQSGGEQRYGALAAAVALRDTSASGASGSTTQSVGTVPTMTPAERAAKLIAAFEDAPPRPLSQITMSVDAGNGTADRVQLALRGQSLNATIDTADARAAQTMTSRSDELVRALSRDGIELEALRVRAGGGNTVTAQAAVSPQTSPDTNTNSRFARENAWQHQQEGQPRQRSQDDRRQQQRDQRGGQQQ
ncbi:MAG: hypothetical protein ACREPM_22815 [Gemmatimonadaceae bacterium]